MSRSVTNDLDVVHIWLFDSEISRKLVLWLNLAFQQYYSYDTINTRVCVMLRSLS